jgi:cytochrome o ubiquinol oxidase subunit 2
MNFIARASSNEDYKKWIETAKASSNLLSLEQYNQLAAPSQNNPAAIYQLKDEDLFNQILMKYMHPQEK